MEGLHLAQAVGHGADIDVSGSAFAFIRSIDVFDASLSQGVVGEGEHCRRTDLIRHGSYDSTGQFRWRIASPGDLPPAFQGDEGFGATCPSIRVRASTMLTTASLFNAIDYVNWIEQWGGADLYNEIYGKFGMVYLPYGVTNNESGFRTNEPIVTLEDLQGKRLRLSGLEQGRLLEKLGGNQVSMAGGEIYQSLERGVIDGAEFSTPNVDYSGGFHQVTKFWATPGWHQSASVFGVMINKASWDALSPETQEDLKIAAQANLIWSLSFTEKRATEAYQQFKDAGIEITRYDDETLARVQELANEVIIETACENPASAKVYLSQLEYLADYAKWRDASAPFNLGRSPNGPDIEAIRACAN